MRIAVGSDHAGFPLKDAVIDELHQLGIDVVDKGGWDTTPSDFPDFAALVGRAIQNGEADRGILLCGSGVGVCIAANKLHGMRAALTHDTYSAHQGVEHDGMNVMCLGSRIIGEAARPRAGQGLRRGRVPAGRALPRAGRTRSNSSWRARRLT